MTSDHSGYSGNQYFHGYSIYTLWKTKAKLCKIMASLDSDEMSAIPSISELPAIILAGGLGTRLRPATGDMPKAIVPVAGEPFLNHLLSRLDHAGIRRAICCTGYGAEQIRQTMGEKFANIDLAYSKEDQPLGTAGALSQSAEHWHAEFALVMNGDTLFDLDLPAFLEWTASKRDIRACLALAPTPGINRYGSVSTNDEGGITRFEEKGGQSSGWINAGIYLLRRTMLDEFPAARPLSLEVDIFPALIGNGLYGFRQQGRFLDIGVPEDYRAAEEFVRA